MKPKSINSLMAYMRDKKGIQIGGSLQKKKLRYMGYYHGYKGYRYCNSPQTLLPYSNFNEMQAVYDFDMQLKSIMYPQIMFMETTIKNYALECVLDAARSERFADVFSRLLTDYKSHPVGSGRFKEAMSRRLKVREHIYNVISRDYKRSLVSHYYEMDKPVPIWSIFELLSLGEFESFLSCLNVDVRKKISQSIGIKRSIDSDGKMVGLFVCALKDLRNAVAHNGTVFDTRFKGNEINHRISSYIESEIRINNITFNTIVDYMILISFLMKLLKRNKTDILLFVKQFEDICETLHKQVPMNIFSKIVYTDTRGKLSALKNYCKF